MIPHLAPELQAAVDQELADIRETVNEAPTFVTYVQSTYGCREVGNLVATDCLARLCEVPRGQQMDTLVARLHAWLEYFA